MQHFPDRQAFAVLLMQSGIDTLRLISRLLQMLMCTDHLSIQHVDRRLRLLGCHAVLADVVAHQHECFLETLQVLEAVQQVGPVLLRASQESIRSSAVDVHAVGQRLPREAGDLLDQRLRTVLGTTVHARRLIFVIHEQLQLSWPSPAHDSQLVALRVLQMQRDRCPLLGSLPCPTIELLPLERSAAPRHRYQGQETRLARAIALPVPIVVLAFHQCDAGLVKTTIDFLEAEHVLGLDSHNVYLHTFRATTLDYGVDLVRQESSHLIGVQSRRQCLSNVLSNVRFVGSTNSNACISFDSSISKLRENANTCPSEAFIAERCSGLDSPKVSTALTVHMDSYMRPLPTCRLLKARPRLVEPTRYLRVYA